MIKRRKFAKITAWTAAFATLVVMSATPALSFAAENKINKDETVYVITDSTGAQNDVIVSDHLKNTDGLDVIEDESNLTDIENVKGDEEFKQDGESLKWEAGGNDIYYQGKTTEKVPVTMDITYFLDGEKISGKKLQGKSGKVKINITYKNSESYNGTKVPFVVLSGFLVEDDCLTDITINNGKIIDDGDRKIVVGMAAPGLAGTLGESASEMGFGDRVTIEGTAKDFNVEDIMTIVTNSMFEDIDADEFGGLDYDKQIDQLDNGAKKLVKGSNQLYEGLEQLDSKVPELSNGVGQLASGASTLSSSVKDTFDQLKAGSNQLQKGMDQFYNGMTGDGTTENPGLIGSLSAIKNGLNNMSTQTGTLINNGKTTLGTASSKLGDAADNVSDASDAAGNVSTNISSAKNSNENANGKIDSAISKLKSKEGELTEEDQEIINLLEGAKSDVDSSSTSLGSASSNNGTVNSNLEKADQNISAGKTAAEGAAAQIEGARQTVAGTINAIAGNGGSIDQVNSGIDKLQKQFYDAATTTGMGPLMLGMAQLNGGLQKASDPNQQSLVTGAKALADNLSVLDDKTGELGEGVGKLDAGAEELSKGMSKLYKDGIKKIVDLYKNELKGTLNDFENVIDAGNNYKSFTKLPANMDGSVKFIYKTTISE